MAELIEHGLSFTEQRPDGSHKLGKRAVVIGAGIGGLATARPASQLCVRFTTSFERVESCNDAETSRTGSGLFCQGCTDFGSRGRAVL